MASSSSILASASAPPVFDGKNYLVWAVKMEAYLRGQLLWDPVETDYEIELSNNPTMAQLKQYEEKVSRKYRALSTLHSALTESVFSRVMTCKTAKEIWDKLKREYQVSDKSKQKEILNLRKDFELLKMNESETVDEYLDRVSIPVNKLRLLGVDLPESRVVEKVMISLPERFEAKIFSLEVVYDLSKLSLSELTNSLRAVERRQQYRESASSMIATNKEKGQYEEASKGLQQKKGKKSEVQKLQKTNLEDLKKGMKQCMKVASRRKMLECAETMLLLQREEQLSKFIKCLKIM